MGPQLKSGLGTRVKHGMKLKSVFNNAKWIIVCKIIQSLLQLVVGMLCARYLGPSNYGTINYAAGLVAFFAPLMKSL